MQVLRPRANFILHKSSLVPRDAASRDRKSLPYVAAVLDRVRPLRPWWTPLVLAALVLGSAPFAIPPIRDAVTSDQVAEAAFRLPAGTSRVTS